MRCVECGSEAVGERPEHTAQGYRRFRCRACSKQWNERTGTVLNRAQYPSDVIALVVLWRLRYKLSLRDLPEMFAVRGMMFSYEAVCEWEAKLTPILAEELRRVRRGKVGRSWHVDETYLKVDGRWCYVYRAIDSAGALVDVLFSERRDMAAAKAFFRSARTVTGITPDRVTTDGHDTYPRAIRTEPGKGVRHRTNRYLDNRLEQDHRGLKGRYRPMHGSQCSAADMQKLPMGKQTRRCSDHPCQPVPGTPRPMSKRLELASCPSDEKGVDPQKGRIQRRLVEVTVVVDPASDIRVEHPGQVVQRLVAPGLK